MDMAPCSTSSKLKNRDSYILHFNPNLIYIRGSLLDISVIVDVLKAFQFL
jgi:hypothetical protein